MKTLLTGLLLAAAMLSALSQANICDRTPQVRDGILLALEADDCAAVDSEALASVLELRLDRKQITTLRAGDFDGLTSLAKLRLAGNQLSALPAGVFDSLTSLELLSLIQNQLSTLPDGVFAGLTSLESLDLSHNRLSTLPDGVFDGLTNLQVLNLGANQLVNLPAGVFDDLTSLEYLDLEYNHLVGLTQDDPLFARLPSGVVLKVRGQEPLGLSQAINICDRTVEVLHAIMFEIEQANDVSKDCAAVEPEYLANLQRLIVRGGYGATTVQASDFDGLTSLEELRLQDFVALTSLPVGVFAGLTNLKILKVFSDQLTDLPVGVFDGLTNLQELHLYRSPLSTLPVDVFDGLTNLKILALRGGRLTSLPVGVFDDLTSLEYLDLANNYLVGLTQDDPLFARLPSGVVFDLSGQIEPPGPPEEIAAAVPLMLSASDSMRQSFVRIINETDRLGSVRILAVDDGGNAANPIEIQLGAWQVLHFNSNDLENGNAGKGINAGVGSPNQGDWRLDIESALALRVLAFVRTTDGFLTAMGDVLQRNGEGRLVAHTFNPGRNMNQVSKLRLVNTGANAERVSIDGHDDQGNTAGPVALTLAAGEARTLSASDLENGAQGLTGRLGDGAGKWRLIIRAGQSVVGMSLLEAVSGHLTNISTMGVATEG